MPVEYHREEVLKIDKTKFFACPNTVITADSWDLFSQVNLCCDGEGGLRHLPESEFSIMDQNPRFMRALEIVRQERNSDWYREKMQQWAKEKQ